MDEFDLHKEPPLHFTPLDEDKYAQFYDIEMSGFYDDLPFYLQSSKRSGSTLELGCGTGRLARQLDQSGFAVTGIDLSIPMLQKAKSYNTADIQYLCSDMTSFTLKKQFDTIIVPYNTLNLLSSLEQVKKCLSICRELLSNDGRLLMQLFVPNQESIRLSGKRIFQFQIFAQSSVATVIKETIKMYQKIENKLRIEERYRIRTKIAETVIREDYNHTIELLAPSADAWLKTVQVAGFTVMKQYGNYHLHPFIPFKSSCLLISASIAG